MLNSKHPWKNQSFHGSSGYSIYGFAQLSWHSTSKNELWMVDLGFPLFYTFLYFSPLLFLSQFSFQNLQDWTLNGKIVDSFFSHPIFLSLFLFKKMQVQLWAVRSWIPTFLMPFSFQRFLSNSSKNELRACRCGGRGRVHHKYMLNSKHPLRKSLLSYVVLVDILSIVLCSCPGTALGRKNFGCSILDSHFSILFSSPFPFTVFFSKPARLNFEW